MTSPRWTSRASHSGSPKLPPILNLLLSSFLPRGGRWKVTPPFQSSAPELWRQRPMDSHVRALYQPRQPLVFTATTVGSPSFPLPGLLVLLLSLMGSIFSSTISISITLVSFRVRRGKSWFGWASMTSASVHCWLCWNRWCFFSTALFTLTSLWILLLLTLRDCRCSRLRPNQGRPGPIPFLLSVLLFLLDGQRAGTASLRFRSGHQPSVEALEDPCGAYHGFSSGPPKSSWAPPPCQGDSNGLPSWACKAPRITFTWWHLLALIAKHSTQVALSINSSGESFGFVRIVQRTYISPKSCYTIGILHQKVFHWKTLHCKAGPWAAKHKDTTQSSATVHRCHPGLQNSRRPAPPWIAKHMKTQ